MTDKVQKIREEVERLKLCTMDEHMKFYSESAEAEYNALCKIDTYIDSLQEEPISEDLEEEIGKELTNQFGTHYDDDATIEITAFDYVNIARHFANWQKEQDKETIELAEDHAMLAGMEKMKEEMMAKAIDAVISQVPCSNEIILYNPSSVDKYYLPQEMNKLGLNKGDKVKLVIIKEN